jgi:hypothetical protein
MPNRIPISERPYLLPEAAEKRHGNTVIGPQSDHRPRSTPKVTKETGRVKGVVAHQYGWPAFWTRIGPRFGGSWYGLAWCNVSENDVYF